VGFIGLVVCLGGRQIPNGQGDHFPSRWSRKPSAIADRISPPIALWRMSRSLSILSC
jgi:hypothetical protein